VRIGAYELLDEIGRGGMGVVHRARDPEGREVALKLLLGASAEARGRFERERRLLAEFTARDGFVPLLDAGDAPQGPWIVMPLLEGGSLRDRLAHGPLPVAETLEIGSALATALGRAHARGIVHRDLKPENVLSSKDGRVLVADLGIARHFDRSAPGASRSVALSASGAILGTAGYAAPEQIGAGGSIAPACDVFAIGAILYECLVGEPPFRAGTVLETIARVSDGRFEPVRTRRPDVPRWLAATIERALARDPRARFQDALLLGRALREPARTRVSVAAIAVVAVAAAVATSMFLVLREPRGATPIAPTPPPAPATPDLAARSAAAIRENRLLDAIAIAGSALALDPSDRRAREARLLAELELFSPDRTLNDDLDALAPGPVRSAILAFRAVAPAVSEPGLEPWIAAYLAARTALATPGSEREPASALREIDAFAKLAPWNASAPLLRGHLLAAAVRGRRQEGDAQGALALAREALHDLDEAVRRCPDFLVSDALRYTRGKLRYEVGDFAIAVEDLGAIATSSPVHGYATLVRAQCLDAMGDADAWRVFRDATNAFAPDGQSRLFLVIAFREGVVAALTHRKRPEALALLGRTLRLGMGPALGVCLEILPQIESRDDLAAEARRNLERDPNDRALLMILGCVEEASGHREAARDAYERLAATYSPGSAPGEIANRIAAVR
jgi:tetratricopeptide (TPR) repeat protein